MSYVINKIKKIYIFLRFRFRENLLKGVSADGIGTGRVALLRTFLSRISEPLKIGDSWFSFLRISAWTVFFLYLAARLFLNSFGYPYAFNAPYMAMLVAPDGDPRAFAGNLPPKGAGPVGPNEFRYAWIDGSQSMIKGPSSYDMLPRQVGTALEKAHPEIKPFALSYVMRALMINEVHVAVLDAIQRNPDFIVISLHPWFTMQTSYYVFRRYMFSAQAQRLPPKLSDWAHYLAFSSPSDWLRAILMKMLNIVRDQAELNKVYNKYIGEFKLHRSSKENMFKVKEDPGNSQPDSIKLAKDYLFGLSRDILVSLSQAQNKSVQDYKKFTIPKIKDPAKAVEKPNLAEAKGTILETTYNQILQILADSKIPTILYITPLGEQTIEKYPENVIFLESKRKFLTKMKEQYPYPNLKFIIIVPEEVRQSINYMDGAHIMDKTDQKDGAGMLPDYLASEIWGFYSRYTKMLNTKMFNRENSIAAWDFNKMTGVTMADYRGINPATTHNVKVVEGYFGNALEFNGTNAHIDTPLVFRDWRHVRISLWVKPEPRKAAEDLSVILDNGHSTSEGFTIQSANTTGQQWVWFCNGGSILFDLPPKEWSHVVVFADADAGTIGVAINEFEPVIVHLEKKLNFGSSKLTFGKLLNSDARYFKGSLDEVAIWNK